MKAGLRKRLRAAIHESLGMRALGIESAGIERATDSAMGFVEEAYRAGMNAGKRMATALKGEG